MTLDMLDHFNLGVKIVSGIFVYLISKLYISMKNDNENSLDELLVNIGSNLRIARLHRNEKLITASNAIGISHTVLSQIENGRYTCLSLKLLLKATDYYFLDTKDVICASFQLKLSNTCKD